MNPKKNHQLLTARLVLGAALGMSCFSLEGLSAQMQPSQTPDAAPPQNEQRIKVESRFVLVDTVVRDKKGNYVRDLTKDDFKVFEDNKEQAIASFSSGSDPAIQASDQRKYLILFFDNSTMDKTEQIQAKAAARKFVESSSGSDRLTSVVDFGGTYQVAQDFTSNADLLRAALTGVDTSRVDPNGRAPANIVDPNGVISDAYQKEKEYGQRAMLLSVRSLAENLSKFPGRKMVVLFSGGFPISREILPVLTSTIAKCNQANVVIYVLDARALIATVPFGSSQLRPPTDKNQAAKVPNESPYAGAGLVLTSYSPGMFEPQRPGGGGSSGGGSSGGSGGTGASGGKSGSGGSSGSGGKGGTGGGGGNSGGSNNQSTYLNNYLKNGIPNLGIVLPQLPPSVTTNQQVLAALAFGTGGFTIFNTNDLLGGLEKIGREQNEFYLLGYVPPPSREGSCHELKVKLNCGGFEVRSRPTYCYMKAPSIPEGTSEEKRLEAHAAGSQAGSLQAAFQVPYFYTESNVARVNLSMEIPSNTLKFENQEGKYHAALNVLGIAYRPDGSIGAKFSDTVNLDLEKDDFKEFTKQPYAYQAQFDAAPGTYKFTIVMSSGDAFGKFERDLKIDEYDGKLLSLGGLVLTASMRKLMDSSASIDAMLLEGRTPLVVKGMMITPSATNHFKNTDNVAVYTEVYEPVLTSSKPPVVAASYHLFDLGTGKLVYSTGSARLDNLIQEGSTMIPVGMSVKVRDLSPGRYRLVMTAVDSAGYHATNRSIDFDITE
jgi:VWFA-related protein